MPLRAISYAEQRLQRLRHPPERLSCYAFILITHKRCCKRSGLQKSQFKCVSAYSLYNLFCCATVASWRRLTTMSTVLGMMTNVNKHNNLTTFENFGKKAQSPATVHQFVGWDFDSTLQTYFLDWTHTLPSPCNATNSAPCRRVVSKFFRSSWLWKVMLWS